MSSDDAVIVALGGNVAGDFGSSEALLEAALARFAEAGLPLLRRSSWWRSAAWPDPNAQEYRNGVVLVEARLSPQDLIQTLFNLEARFGRKEARKTRLARSISTSSPTAVQSRTIQP